MLKLLLQSLFQGFTEDILLFNEVYADGNETNTSEKISNYSEAFQVKISISIDFDTYLCQKLESVVVNFLLSHGFVGSAQVRYLHYACVLEFQVIFQD